MEDFSNLLDDLYFTNSTRAKERILARFLSVTGDPERGWALAAIAGTLSFDLFKRNLAKGLIVERMDEELFALSYDYVGELSETIALCWPVSQTPDIIEPLPALGELISAFNTLSKDEIRFFLIGLLDTMTPSQRWALLKLGTRGLRIGMSARSVKKVLAGLKEVAVDEIEELWHGLEPPYTELFAWIDGRAGKPVLSNAIRYLPVMLSHPLEAGKDLEKITPQTHFAEWKWDGIRVQIASDGKETKIFSRTGENISHSFPDLANEACFEAVIDGELLVLNSGELGSFNELQQRLNKKKPTARLMREWPAHFRMYDLLSVGGKNVRNNPLEQRRMLLEDLFNGLQSDRFSLSELLPFEGVSDLVAYRQEAARSKGRLEGLMLKRRQGSYVSGRPKHEWYKWKCDPLLVDAVLMYAQRGHGKRSSYYSDYTFGLWNETGALLPVGKAYFGFTDDELKQLDAWIRKHKQQRFGPVQEVEKKLVFEVAFDSAHVSKRHKSGFALRFPRISRIRWDKPAHEADCLDQLARLVEGLANTKC